MVHVCILCRNPQWKGPAECVDDARASHFSSALSSQHLYLSNTVNLVSPASHMAELINSIDEELHFLLVRESLSGAR